MSESGWVADRRIGWRILLTAELSATPDPASLLRALTRLYADQGWPAVPPLTTAATVEDLQADLVMAAREPVLLGLAGDRLVISAHHSAVDGLGLLEVLARCGFGPARSDARAFDDPSSPHLAVGALGRLSEALLRPPARPPAPLRDRLEGDVLVARDVADSWRTTDLVHAAASALGGSHVAIAIGASRRVRAAGERLADDSALLRLRDVERMDRDAVRAAIRGAHTEASPHSARGLVARAMGVGLRVLSPRLGSTLLVSHLGQVTAPDVRGLAFHPVTAGGSGLSMGAVGIAGRTTLTLRARASAWDADGLEQLLEAIATHL